MWSRSPETFGFRMKLFLKVKAQTLVFLFAILFTFFVLLFIRHRGALYAGYDGIQHLTNVESQIVSFRHFQGATNFSSMSRYIGDGRPMIVYQGFYWYAGFIGALFRLNGFESVKFALIFLPLFCFIVTYFSFFWIQDAFVRSAIAFLYSFSPMLLGMCFHTASWPQTFAVAFISIVISGGWLLWSQGNPYLLALGFAIVTVCHPVTGFLLVPWALPLSFFAIYKHRNRLPHLLFHGLVAVSFILVAISYLFFGKIDPNYAFASPFSVTGGQVSRELIHKQTLFLMNLFGKAESSSRFAQVYQWPNPESSSSLGLAGCLSALFVFILFPLFNNLRKSRYRLSGFESYLVFGAAFYLLAVWPWDWLQVTFKEFFAPYFPIVTNLFPNRLLPHCLMFCIASAGAILIERYQTKISRKKLLWIGFSLIFMNSLQVAQGLHITPPGDVGPLSIFEDARLSDFYYGNKENFRKEFLWEEERRPRPNTAHTYVQPSRLWRWRNTGKEWEKAEWNSSPNQVIHTPFHEFQPEISTSGVMPEGAGDYRVSLKDVPKGVHKLSIRFRLFGKNFSNHFTVPFEAQIVHGYPSLEAWILPEKIKWEEIPLKADQTLEVPFEIETESKNAPYLIFRKFTGYMIQLVSIEIYALNELPFKVSNYQNLEFTLPKQFLSVDRELSLPRFELPGYHLWEKLPGGELKEIPLEESEFATPKAYFAKSNKDIRLALTFVPKSFAMNHRFFLFIVSSVVLLMLTILHFRKTSLRGLY